VSCELRALAIVLSLLLPGAEAKAEDRTAARSSVTIGVAPFELVAPPGELAPDLSGPVAERLGALGVERVVGPETLGAAALASPAADAVRTWASKSQVAVVVVGRATRVGSGLNLDVWLRSGSSGEVERSYVQSIPGSEDLDPALEELAVRIADGAARLLQGPRADHDGFDRDEPLQIRSGKLDRFQSDGRRRLVFTDQVVVTQDDLRVTADRLEAVDPEKSNQPDQLIARGHVVFERGARSASCREAIYHREQGRLVCKGEAELRDGPDRVSGDVIEFDIDSDRVVVSGSASVLMEREDDAPLEEATGAQVGHSGEGSE
jgi:lipopolysaccharide export system protein LptA